MNPVRSSQPGLSTGEKVCWLLALLGSVMTVAPFAAEDFFRPWNGGQYAMVLIGLTLALSMAISTFYFRRRRLVRDALFDEKQLLVHWRYGEAEWRSFVGEDFARERRDKWAMFRIVAFFCVVIGGGFALYDWEGGRWVLGVLLGLCLIIGVVIVTTTRGQRARREAGGGEARVGEDGLWLSGELHVWNGFGARLESCEVIEGQPPCIEIVYSTPAKNQRQINSVRVPIPEGSDAEAARIVVHFRQQLGGR